MLNLKIGDSLFYFNQVLACQSFIEQQIRIVKVIFILLLGNEAFSATQALNYTIMLIGRNMVRRQPC